MALGLLPVILLAVGAAAIVHERRNVDSFFGPSKGGRLNKNAIFPLRIGLQQQNLDDGYDYLMDVSHPTSSNYGKHWTLEEVNEKFQPSVETVKSVKNWLLGAGIPEDAIKTTHNGGWMAIDISAGRAEDLFQTEFFEYYTDRDDSLRIGCDRYSLPDDIAHHIDYVTPGVTLSPPITRRAFEKRDIQKRNSWGGPPGHWPHGPGWHGPPHHPPHGPPHWRPPPGLPPALQNCAMNITPTCIRALYDIPLPSQDVAGNDLGVFEEGDVYAQQDLNLFFEHYAPFVPDGTHPTLNSINGATAPVPPGSPSNTGESDIDLDLGFSLLYPQGIQLYQVGFPAAAFNGTQAYEIQLTFLTPFFDAIDGTFCTNGDKEHSFECGGVQLTNVLTASYSSPEVDETLKSAVRTCNEIMKLSLQGHTILFSSGDYGVASHPQYLQTDGCIPRSLNISGRDNGPIFSPQFPGNCPYVLSVGGTQLNSNDTVYDPESVMQVPGLSPYPNAYFSSSGGFANYFGVP